ncbi:hypothetical protein B0T26DRAFT_705987 [Lasiosphaeria miniovina]|uniref:Uncharacterized protein n=1 Tax=Lasiosphaeria miniovina TaxID=1954250 RepID=A0AA40AWG6_9PEZI|nr:uncharacterized protein B0T26DRAFT_705987 [Lasiosphaeria miniovina]KAK0723287.1 hypothetical protein B0T26DRAFT_705987 [Lasiosphaeria miniovina]
MYAICQPGSRTPMCRLYTACGLPVLFQKGVACQILAGPSPNCPVWRPAALACACCGFLNQASPGSP